MHISKLCSLYVYVKLYVYYIRQSCKNFNTIMIILRGFFQVSLVVFGVYVLISPDNILDASTAFVSLAVINIMNFSVSLLPITILYGAQVSLYSLHLLIESQCLHFSVCIMSHSTSCLYLLNVRVECVTNSGTLCLIWFNVVCRVQ